MHGADFDLSGDLDDRAKEHVLHLRGVLHGIGDEQSATGGRRERHAHLELRVVLPAGMVEGLGPAGIEHVLAVGMGLQVHGHHADRIVYAAVALAEHDVERLPAGLGRDAAALLQGVEESMVEEGVVLGAWRVRAAIPCHRVDGVDVLEDPGGVFGQGGAGEVGYRTLLYGVGQAVPVVRRRGKKHTVGQQQFGSVQQGRTNPLSG